MTTNCEQCRFWSDLMARFSPRGMEAVCLNAASPRSSVYTLARDRCAEGRPSYGAAVDEPGLSADFHEAKDRAAA